MPLSERYVYVDIPLTCPGFDLSRSVLGLRELNWPEADYDHLWGFDVDTGLVLQHLTVDQMVDRFRVPPTAFSSKISFCVVRNPYDRVLTAYAYFGGDGAWRSVERYLEFVSGLLRASVENHEVRKGKRAARSRVLGALHYVRPQVHFLRGNRAAATAVSRILRYERLDEDLCRDKDLFYDFCEHSAAASAASSSRWKSGVTRRRFRDFERVRNLTARARALLEEIYEEDFEFLGYYKHNPATPLETMRYIYESNLLFFSAQPDQTYFHWQVKTYLHNFATLGLQDFCVVLFGAKKTGETDHRQEDEEEDGGRDTSSLSAASKLLARLKGLTREGGRRRRRSHGGGAKKVAACSCFASSSSPAVCELRRYFRVFAYHDARSEADKKYAPTIRPFLLAQHLRRHPAHANFMFFHDADVVFSRLPRFERVAAAAGEGVDVLSDTRSYLGYKYLVDCGKRFEAAYPDRVASSEDLVRQMCARFGIDPAVVRRNDAGSGGAQCLLRNAGAAYWENVLRKCIPLHDLMEEYNRRYPAVENGVQVWVAEMFCMLWSLWQFGRRTKLHKELDFSWATHRRRQFHDHPILHVAGVTAETKGKVFRKYEFIAEDLIRRLAEEPDFLRKRVAPDQITYEYAKIMESCSKRRIFRQGAGQK